MNILARIILIAALLAMGCSSPTSVAGGGTDFPNSTTTAAVMGADISTNIASGNQWGDSVALTDTLPSPSGGVNPSVPALPAAGVTWNLSDTTLGIVLAYDSIAADSFMERDTFVVLDDAAYRTGIPAEYHVYTYRGAKAYSSTGIVQRYSYTDASGDSILNNGGGLPNRATVAWSSTDASGAVTTVNLTVDGGADDNLATAADNRILASRIGRFGKTGDTLGLTTFIPYAADSVVFDPAIPDSCLVRFLTIDNTVAGKRAATEAVMVVFPADSAKNYTAYLASQVVFPGGRTVLHRVRGVHADSLYFAGDTVLADRIIDSPLVNTLDTLRYTFIKGPNPLDNSGNRLLALHRHVTRAAGGERERVFTLDDSSVAPGAVPVSGPLFWRQVFAGGYWVQLDGGFGVRSITGDYTDSNGKTGTLSWTRAGAVQ